MLLSPSYWAFQGFRQQSANCQVQLKQMAVADVFFSLLERTQFIKSQKEISSGSWAIILGDVVRERHQIPSVNFPLSSPLILQWANEQRSHGFQVFEVFVGFGWGWFVNRNFKRIWLGRRYSTSLWCATSSVVGSLWQLFIFDWPVVFPEGCVLICMG